MGFRLVPKSVTLNDLERRIKWPCSLTYLGETRELWGPIT